MKEFFYVHAIEKRKIKELLLFCLLLTFAFILTFGKGYSYAVTGGITLWAVSVLPSLFPYFFITTALSSLSITGKISKKLSPLFKRLFNVNGVVGYAYILSLISGYPIGAKTVSELRNKGLISESESVRAIALCSTSSPNFITGVVGVVMFNSLKFGKVLLLTHIASSFFVGFIFSFYKRKEKITESEQTFSSSNSLLYDSAYSSVISVLVVGGLITLFYLITEILYSSGILSPFINGLNIITGNGQISRGITFGLLECTRGIKELSTAKISLTTFLSSAFLCGFGGLSVIIQALAYIKNAKIKTAPFFLSKILHAVLSLFFGLFFYTLFF